MHFLLFLHNQLASSFWLYFAIFLLGKVALSLARSKDTAKVQNWQVAKLWMVYTLLILTLHIISLHYGNSMHILETKVFLVQLKCNYSLQGLKDRDRQITNFAYIALCECIHFTFGLQFYHWASTVYTHSHHTMLIFL